MWPDQTGQTLRLGPPLGPGVLGKWSCLSYLIIPSVLRPIRQLSRDWIRPYPSEVNQKDHNDLQALGDAVPQAWPYTPVSSVYGPPDWPNTGLSPTKLSPLLLECSSTVIDNHALSENDLIGRGSIAPILPISNCTLSILPLSPPPSIIKSTIASRKRRHPMSPLQRVPRSMTPADRARSAILTSIDTHSITAALDMSAQSSLCTWKAPSTSRKATSSFEALLVLYLGVYYMSRSRCRLSSYQHHVPAYWSPATTPRTTNSAHAGAAI